ncbi:murein transglycosylase A [Oculatella sp. LEGE 06141]|uniref:murein transglycosylase A n=1 Tax=Oculatella sp. LEGE 06141 TaxID=1828648 RepID=UPI001882C5C6|nr:murein transglycosylase A [Oculatella sp. LEGE 06141]MBE9178002.1 murein transglycosylase A [Oculatella sp. LEGE 06141]
MVKAIAAFAFSLGAVASVAVLSLPTSDATAHQHQTVPAAYTPETQPPRPLLASNHLPLQPVSWADLEASTPFASLLGIEDQFWDRNAPTAAASHDRQMLLTAIDHSLRYLRTSAAASAYRQYPVPGVTLNRVRRSLERFRQLVLTAQSPTELRSAVIQEFDVYQSVGRDGQGTVAFTGYFEPTYAASRTPTPEYRYPLYRVPANLNRWPRPHPTRAQLEGIDGLQGSQNQLRGLELVWLRDRFEAFLVQVQGSARLQLTDGSTMTVGVAGHTDYPYVGVGRELVNAGKFRLEDLSLPVLIQYFQDNPADLNAYLPRNNRFVFFRETAGAPATGSLGLPVTAERSIATDKSLMPPGALALIQTQIPYANAQGQLESRLVSRYVLDQDTGGAIRGAGRVDLFMGTGALAGDRAGLINATGQLYYLLLRN